MPGEWFKKYAIKLGYAPTRRNIFSREDAGKYKRLVEEKLKSWGVDFVNIDWLNEEGLLYDEADVPRVAAKFREEGVDAVFVPHCNFGTEAAAAQLGKAMDKPFLLWGPRDEAPLPDGLRLRDTQCGLFATSKILRRLGVPFTYIVNSRVDDPVFEEGFRNFMAAVAAVKAFRNLRIGQIGTRPQAFWTMMVNEGELLERFGIEVVPITLVEIVDEVKARIAKGDPALAETVADIKSKADTGSVSDDIISLLASLKVTIAGWAKRENLNAVAIQCWDALQQSLGIVPCFVNAKLTEEGLPTVCETDIHGAATAVMLQAANMGRSSIFFADLTIRHPRNDNAELLWHCGIFPVSLAKEGSSRRLSEHYILPSRCPGVGEWELRSGDVTIARFDGDSGEYKLFIGHARGTEGPMTRGTYLWVEVDDWPKWEEKLIRGPYVHHVVAVHGRVGQALYEACRYIPGLEPDPIGLY